MTGPGSGPQRVNDQNNGPGQQAPPPPNYGELGSGQAKADFASASANGGWEFDPVAMDAVIKSLEDCVDTDFRRAQDEASWLTQIKPAGDEVGSHGYTTAANASGAAYQAFLEGARDYTTSYLGTLKQIRTAYQAQDQAAIDALRQIGKVD
ncbi:hypothetical protein [Amycolatopsis sp. BJA-103]|uniref:hypothetical protein n=1 Tax=Amycolatopsis sp. BJA-103 TaxID=1911175 RepID=UPI000C7901B8|nr:hypothetical protein [Amycolatopsis sp. BJA-103]AUI62527.1 hypothetical protein BKN51_33140 [Amycolatopsis sp. BJA-103]PNE18364.1 hypothetical protein B1H26_10825 [Amycolatopsis sp. BJA-103]